MVWLSGGEELALFNIEKGSSDKIHTFPEPRKHGIIDVIDVSPDGQYLFWGGGFWDIRKEKLAKTLTTEFVPLADFSGDGSSVVITSTSEYGEPLFEVYTVPNGKKITGKILFSKETNQETQISSLKLSPDGTLVAIGTREGTVMLWGLYPK